MNGISLLIVAVVVLGLAVAWWRRFSMALALILVNFLIGLLMVAGDLRLILEDLAARPAFLSVQYWPQAYTIFTSMFLHAGFQHLWSNMLVFLLLGLPFEDRVGRGRLLAIYFLGGFVGFLAHSLWVLSQAGAGPERAFVPVVGASAAVFAVLGAFATLYPRDQVHFPFVLFIRMPVIVGAVILMFFETVLLLGLPADAVSHSAHLGGAAGGVVFALLLRPRAAARGRSSTDFARLERLTDERGREFVARMRENADVPELQHAWFERLLPRLACPTCQSPLREVGRGRLACANGHEERYDA